MRTARTRLSLEAWIVVELAIGSALGHAQEAKPLELDPLRAAEESEILRVDRDSEGAIRGVIVDVRDERFDFTLLTTLPRLETIFVQGSLASSEVSQISNCRHLRGFAVQDGSMLGDADVAMLTSLTALEDLRLPGARITDGSAAWLCGMRELRRLDLSGTGMGDAGLARLAELPALEYVDLRATRVTDGGLAHIGEWKHLQTLDLSRNAIDGSGFDALASLSELDRLELQACNLTDSALARLTPLRQLRELPLSGNQKLGDSGIAALARLPFLTRLELGGTGVTSAGIEPLTALTHVRSVFLADTAIDDAAMAHLARMSGLEFASVDCDGVTPAGLERLAKESPSIDHIALPDRWSDAQRRAFAAAYPRLTAGRCGGGGYAIPWHEQLDRNRRESEQRTRLARAIERGDVEVVRDELLAGAPAEAFAPLPHGYDARQRTLLFRALELKRSKIARLLIAAGANVNARDHWQRTPLHLAVANDDVEVISFLVEAGADLQSRDEDGRTPLLDALNIPRAASFRRLRDLGARLEIDDELESLIGDAAHFGRVEVLELVLGEIGSLAVLGDRGCDTIRLALVGDEPLSTIAWLLQHGADARFFDPSREWQPLFAAIEKDRRDVVKLLLDAGTDPNLRTRSGWTAVAHAAELGRLSILEELLARGATKEGLTAIEFRRAVENHAEAEIRRLVAVGVDPDFPDPKWGRTPLALAALEGDVEAMRLLLELGADPEQPDWVWQKRALAYAVEGESLPAIELLLEHGVNIDAREVDNQTALDLARKQGLDAIVRRLETPTLPLPKERTR